MESFTLHAKLVRRFLRLSCVVGPLIWLLLVLRIAPRGRVGVRSIHVGVGVSIPLTWVLSTDTLLALLVRASKICAVHGELAQLRTFFGSSTSSKFIFGTSAHRLVPGVLHLTSMIHRCLCKDRQLVLNRDAHVRVFIAA